MNRPAVPLVPSWLRDPLAKWGNSPLFLKAGRRWYRGTATRVARRLYDLVEPTALFLKGSAAWDDVSPALSDLDFAVEARAETGDAMAETVMTVRRYLETVHRPWIPLGEVSWILPGEQPLFQHESRRLAARHFYLKKFQPAAQGEAWERGGWGEHASPRGLFEHALDKYLDGFRQLQYGAQALQSPTHSLRQAARFWGRSLRFLQAARSGEFSPALPSPGEAGWENVAKLAHQCLAELDALCPLVADASLVALPQREITRGYALHLQEGLLKREISVRVLEEAPYYFETDGLSAAEMAAVLQFTFAEATELAVKVQFPLFTRRLARYYASITLPRVANLASLFETESGLAPMAEGEWRPFAADILFRSTEALIYRNAGRLRAWSRALPRLAAALEKQGAATADPLRAALLQRSPLFLNCASRLEHDRPHH